MFRYLKQLSDSNMDLSNSKSTGFLSRFLEYPKEYNPRVHGPYDPSRYYGKPDPLMQTKIGDFGNWLGRREFSLRAIGQALTRASWRYNKKYLMPKKANAAFVYHVALVAFVFSYFTGDYDEKSKQEYE